MGVTEPSFFLFNVPFGLAIDIKRPVQGKCVDHSAVAEHPAAGESIVDDYPA